MADSAYLGRYLTLVEYVSGVLVFSGQHNFVGDLAFLPSLRQNLLFEYTFQCSVRSILT